MQAEKNMEKMNEFLKIMAAQNMSDQGQDVKDTLIYIIGLQAQMLAMTKELQEVKEQLNKINAEKPDIVHKKDINLISGIQKRVSGVTEHLETLKNSTFNTIKNSVETYKKQGKDGMKSFLQKGIASIKGKLQWCREQLLKVLHSCKEANRRLDAIGNELAKIGYSVGNIGKIATGKEAKSVGASAKGDGVALTRMMKAPINKVISFIEKQVTKLDTMINKLEQISERLNPMDITYDEKVIDIINNTELSVTEKTEQLINLTEKAIFNKDEKKFILNYADKVKDIEKVNQLIKGMEKAKNISSSAYSEVIEEAHKEMKDVKIKDKDSVLNKLHSNQEKLKNAEPKGEERTIKREEIQK